MFAIRVHEPGGPDVLKYEDISLPEVRANQVRVRIRAAGINHRDIWVRQGLLGPMGTGVILGSDGAGEVDAIGAGVTNVEVGQKIVINPGVGCGSCPACLSGNQPSCQTFDIINGTYAEYVVVPKDNVVPMPSGITFTEAASIGVPFITAEDFLARTNGAPGQTILIWGASGGLGTATIQLAKLRGLRVIAVTRSVAKSDKLRQLQADDVIVWDGHSGIAADVLALTNGRGADIVVDSLGQATFAQSLKAGRQGATIVSVGGTTGGTVSLELGQVFRRRQTILGAYMGGMHILPRLLPLFSRGILIPVIDYTFPLEQADQAHEQLEQRGVFGKVILEV